MGRRKPRAIWQPCAAANSTPQSWLRPRRLLREPIRRPKLPIQEGAGRADGYRIDEGFMPLKGRVGRHASDGRQCQNWKADQQTVVDLLNLIPVADGGTAGYLRTRIVAGLASTELYQAILTFEKKHFAGQVRGFVDPGGAVLAKLEALAHRPPVTPPAPPKPKNQWDAITSKSVMAGVRAGLADDNKLSHAEVINIVRSTLSDGVITQNEISDLRELASASKSLEARSRNLLFKLANTLAAAKNKPLELRGDDQKLAAEFVCKFMLRSGNPCWPGLDRDQVGASLLMRIANPSFIDQNQASLCGPSALMFGLAADHPGDYAKFAIELFEKGEAPLGRHNTVRPSSGLRRTNPGLDIDQADWMTSGSLRSSENIVWPYSSTDAQVGGITTAWELARWLGDAGYRDVREETNAVRDKDESNLREASRLYEAGYRTVLFIDSGLLYTKTQSKDSGIADRHWVVLTSKVQIASGNVNFTVYTWGAGERTVPENPNVPLSLNAFLENYHGYVAGRPY
jgi:hypothetical protein